jgi:PAS domain S-box-containing protein
MSKLGRALARLERQTTSEGAVRARAETLLTQASNMRVALLIANNSGRYVDANDQASRLTGFSRSELVRMSVWDLTPTPSVATARRMWKEFLDAGRMSGLYPLRRKEDTDVRAYFHAWAHVLPGVHVSALATPALLRSSRTSGRKKAR